jgi:hypothetical protein
MRVSGVLFRELRSVGVNRGDVCADDIDAPTGIPPTIALPTAANSGVLSVATSSSAWDCASLLQTGQNGFRVVNHWSMQSK